MIYNIKRFIDHEFNFEGTFNQFKTQLDPSSESQCLDDPYAATYQQWIDAEEIEELIDVLNTLSDCDDFYIYYQEDPESVLYDVVTIADAVKLTGLSERGIRFNCESGKYNARKSGKIWLIEKSTL